MSVRSDAFLEAALICESHANNIAQVPSWATASTVRIAKTSATLALEDVAKLFHDMSKAENTKEVTPEGDK